jgi:toxin ParE1/3/4
MKHIKIGKDAALELEEPVAWYEMEQQGLGMRFVSAFEHALELLNESSPPLTPVQGNAGKKGARKLILHKFPFSVIVLEKEETIVIVALAHHSRRPGYWRSRVVP